MSSAFGSFFTAWEATETNYQKEIFSEDNDTVIVDLWDVLQDGMISTMPIDIDLSSITSEAQKIVYGQMIPLAWSVAPGKFVPYIFHDTAGLTIHRKTGDSCSSNTPGDISFWITSDAVSKSKVCWNGNTLYVLGVSSSPDLLISQNQPDLGPGSPAPFVAIPGGTTDVLDGNSFGSVMLDDMVISAYSGYLQNGNRNGYQVPSNGGSTDGLFFSGGIQTAGFFTLQLHQHL
ncbi:uncharacterized protein N7458_001056 [Penicillium daleae]|uniref:Uncharacterized protein n=1 Tax=Penicillium daleae TaxID=63821 RepID=A0AAD6G4K9_9EURO|nr:uncharacterized protein N7458_001056 [Penicillium daleae]KAJ5459504.1 hypothetical protein N7458_001056 [Penicillium daleae]